MDAEGFDKWHAHVSASDAHAELNQRTLGLPASLDSNGLVPWTGIDDVVHELALAAGDLLVDLGCGRGGYGLEIARRTGARLIGIDFSSTAIERAQERATGSDAEFRVGNLTASGLPDHAAAAVVSLDSMQFAEPYAAGLRECRRLLVPGGRVVLSGWEALEREDEGIPPRLRHDIGAELTSAGFEGVTVTDQPAWRAVERQRWAVVLDIDPAGDPGLEALRREATSVVTWLERSRRVLAVGSAPAAS
jgi:SAM-dependent methyltransferase